jgi:hypothetical protein
MQNEQIEAAFDRIRHRHRPVENRQPRLRHDRAIEAINGLLLAGGGCSGTFGGLRRLPAPALRFIHARVT